MFVKFSARQFSSLAVAHSLWIVPRSPVAGALAALVRDGPGDPAYQTLMVLRLSVYEQMTLVTFLEWFEARGAVLADGYRDQYLVGLQDREAEYPFALVVHRRSAPIGCGSTVLMSTSGCTSRTWS
jgi:hypothetical protein